MDKLTTKPTTSPRKKVIHGIKFWLRTGKINPSIRGYKKIQKYLMDLETQLIEESGGQANLTAAREILIRSTIRGYGVIMLAELYSSKYSILRPDDAKRGVMSFQPILERSYANIFGQVRQNLLALGLDRKVEDSLNLKDYIRLKYGDEAEVKPSQGNQSEDGEKDDPGASGEEKQGAEGALSERSEDGEGEEQEGGQGEEV